MTLDEAIKHAEEVAEENEHICRCYPDFGYDKRKYKVCASEHRQLAEWLRELKKWRTVRNRLSQNRIATSMYGDVVMWNDIKRVIEEVKADEDRL